MECLVCNRIEMIKNRANPYFVEELETGYVVIGDHQHFHGYALFLCKRHCIELHELPRDFKLKFLEEMSLVAEAVFHAFQPDKMHYELLGNGDTHLHWHLFPRTEGDSPVKGPVWWLPKEEMYDASNCPSQSELKDMVEKLRKELQVLLTK